MLKNYSFIKLLFWLSLAFSSVICVTFAGLYLYLNPKLPEVQSLREVKLQTPLRIYSSDNKLIGEFGEQRRDPITYEQIPPLYIQALLSAEDAQFYDHNGVSIRGLLRATSQLVQTGQIQSGGSTITMQLARNFFLTMQQTFARKFNEILLALKIERELSKQEILTLYTNKIYLGNRAYGIQAAARIYYGKDIDQLNLAQLAMIAGLPKAPSAYNPLANPERALIRRNWILGRMHDLGHIDAATRDAALNEPITARRHGLSPELYAPYIAEMARTEIIERFGNDAYTDGYRVYTTVNAHLQEIAQQAVVEGILTFEERKGYRGRESTLTDSPEQEWPILLAGIPTYGGLVPAAVAELQEQSASVILASGEMVELGWEQGLSAARPYINENVRGPSPDTASDVLTVGDVIRLKRVDDQWQLSQLPVAEAALVALAPDDGAIISMSGGFDFRQSNFNRVTQAGRQAGSSFKPFIYATALENGYTPASIINDAPIVIEDANLESTWRPENDGGTFLGPMRMRTALYRSRNMVSIRLLRSLGLPLAHTSLERFGFPKGTLPYDLSLALGSHNLTPLKLAEAYATLANGGYKVEPYLIERIETVSGEVVFQSHPATVCRNCVEAEADATHELQPLASMMNLEPKTEPAARPSAPRVMDEQTAYMIDSMLRDVITRGTGRRARVLERSDIAGKTGTTNGPRDAWFAGYSPHMVAIAWLGFDQNTPLGNREFGGTAALPIWIDYMREALAGKPDRAPVRPDGIVTVRINPHTGRRAAPNDPDAIFEIFRAGQEPSADTTSGNAGSDSHDLLPEDLF